MLPALRTLRPLIVVAGLAALAGGCATTPAGPRPLAFPKAPDPAGTGAVSGPSAGAPVTTRVEAAPALARLVADTALELRGVPYRFGGEDPLTGLDCSGLVRYVFGLHSFDLPRTVAEQFDAGRRIRPEDLRAGDLLFFSTIGPGPTHVGIVLGGNQFVHAPGTGSVVRVERYDTPYWERRFLGARRVF